MEEAARQLDSVIDDEAAWIENRIEACAGLADSLDRLGDAGGACLLYTSLLGREVAVAVGTHQKGGFTTGRVEICLLYTSRCV